MDESVLNLGTVRGTNVAQIWVFNFADPQFAFVLAQVLSMPSLTNSSRLIGGLRLPALILGNDVVGVTPDHNFFQ